MKKLMISSIVLLPVVVLMILLISSSVVAVKSHIYVEAVIAKTESIYLKMEDEEQKPETKMDVQIRPFSATNKKLVYSSDDQNVVTIDENGVIKAVDFGKTFVRAHSKEDPSLGTTVEVTVFDNKVHRLEFSCDKQVIYVGQTYPTNINVIPTEAENKSVTYKSSDSRILEVTQNGRLRGVSAGTASVTVESDENSSVQAQFSITVRPTVKELTIPEEESEVFVTSGKTAKFPQVTILPSEAEEEITYLSSNDAVAKVDSQGNITFTKAGRVRITAQVIDGMGNKATVYRDYICTDGHYTTLAFNESETEFNFADYEGGTELPLSLVGGPDGASQPLSVSYSIDGVVEYREGKFYALSPNASPVTITVTAQPWDWDGNESSLIKATKTIKIYQDATDIQVADSMFIAANTFDLAKLCKPAPASATASIEYRCIQGSATYKGTYATFVGEGLFIFKAIITNHDGETVEKSFLVSHINAKPEETAFQLTQGQDQELTLKYEEQPVLYAINYLPEPGYTAVAYKSTNTGTAQVDEHGHLSITRGGKAEIQITSSGEGKEDVVTKISISVSQDVQRLELKVRSGWSYVAADRISTSQTKYVFQVKAYPDSSVWDKEFIVPENVRLTSGQYPNNGTYTLEATFDKPFDGEFVFKFNNEDSVIGRFPVHFTGGQVDDIKLLDSKGTEVDYSKTYDIVNGQELKFSFPTTFSPEDFKISKVQDVAVQQNDFVESSVTKSGSTYYVTLTSKSLTKEPTFVGITLGGKTVYLKVRVLQDATGITTKGTDTTYTNEYDLYLDGNLKIEPETTNDIRFETDSDIASVSSRGIVTFTSTGAAKITIKAYDHEGTEKASGEITVTYQAKSTAQKEVHLTADNVGQEQKLVLDWKRGQVADKAVIKIDTIDGYTTREVLTQGEAVNVDQNSLEITAVKGGFATITVNLGNGGGDTKTWTIKVFVDCSLTTKEFSLEDNTITSKKSLDFSLTLGTKDEFEGKQLVVSGGDVTENGHSEVEGKVVYNFTVNFKRAETLTITISFVYNDQAKAFFEDQSKTSDTAVALTLVSTYGKADKLNVYHGEDSLEDGHTMETLVNQPITLKLESVEPAGFVLSKEAIEVSGWPFEVNEVNGHFEIVVTPDHTCMNGGLLYITVGDKTLTLVVKAYKNTSTIKVLNHSVLSYANEYSIFATLDEDSTNTFKYEVVENGDVASVDQNGKLTFNREGVVVVKVSAMSHLNEEIVSTLVTVTYVNKAENEREVLVSENTSSEELVLQWAEEKENGLLAIKFKAGFVQNVTIEARDQEIVQINGYHIEALKGGETIVTITAHKGDEVWTKEVRVIISRHATSISFATLDDQELNDGFATARTTFEYYVKVAPADAMALSSKNLVCENTTFAYEKTEGNVAYYKATTTLSSVENKLVIRIVNGQVEESLTTFEFTSTLDDVYDFTLYHDDQVVDEDNNSFSFANIGQNFKLGFYLDLNSFRPADFEFDTSKVNISYNGGSNLVVTPFTLNDNKLSFAFYSIESDTTLVTISIGTKSVSFSLICNPLADAIEVRCNGRELQNGHTYETFLDMLTFDVRLTREDGIVPKTNKISYSLNGTDQGTFSVGSIRLGQGTYVFKADGLEFTLIITNATGLGNITITLSHAINGGSRVLLDSIIFAEATSQDVGLSFDMISPLTVTLGFELSDLLGEVSKEIVERLFKVTAPEGWEINYAADGVITIKPNTTAIVAQDIHLEYLDKTVTYTLTKLDIGEIKFVGFDMDKPVGGNDEEGIKMVNPDIYGNGYQQVKVFAKHSYYYVNEQWRKVDFFRLPIDVLAGSLGKADISVLDFITWEMTAYMGKSANTMVGTNGLITRQLGRNIRYMSQTYTLNEDGSVTDSQGTKIVDENGCFVGSDKITFVDPYTEYDPEGTSYVRVYFGNFEGLTEEDIQNDRFGAFYTLGEPTGEQTYYETARYMRVTADDHVGHFKEYNFNVVEDGFTNEKNEPVEAELVNISDTQAFYDNKHVVLQGNFTEDMLTTADNSLLDKEFIYGNGYEINLQYKSRNGGGNFVYGKAYNLYIKGGDPDYQNSGHDDRVLEINGTFLLYCDVSAVNKGNIWRLGDDVHIKNTIFKYCKECAIQIYKKSTTVPNKVYIENLTIVDCLAAIEFVVAELPDNDGSVEGYYIKGYIDVFNYRSRSDLDPFLDDFGNNKQTGLIMIDEAIAQGKKEHVVETYNDVDYFNLLIFNSQTKFNIPELESSKRTFHYFDIETQQYKMVDTSGSNAKLTYRDGVSQYDFLRMKDAAGLLNSVVGVGIWGYGNRSDIKVSCQYKLDEEGNREFNSDHLKWHMQRVKRDHKLIGFDYSTHKVPA